ncbi:DUF4919 domain-containing protein [Chryseobacterium sp. Ch-15]|uniref:DUF4919 domain-containing protein n=1 Tax=Chryseobacterium muglaense TaxID=2893752 RepID=A0A9Q3UT38_9FLAO|nr:DUF4919 domain-containing protein [Chryseobacterium muglaense]MBD3904990.1 DUF4919 domain-containing protein [Chryseobacterium muglaense]MCC9035143.1 DUF4919 domain-containing protein [Chryseobacterium muglaense]MCM2554642.1 DUF4919 domain-containing protein [Chryseobacterium muglaense]
MNYRILFFLFIIPFFGLSQKTKLDLKNIGKNLTNPTSVYNYDRLIFKYKGLPKSIDSTEAQHLYYGRNFKKDLVSQSGDEFKGLAEAFKNNNFLECIKLGKALYAKDPTNLDVILILLRAYDQTKDMGNFSHHIAQLRLLTDAIKNSGDGKSEKTAYKVNSVGDEYIFLNMMNVGQDYTRASKTLKDGVIDIWEKEENRIYIKVLYLD